MDFHCSSTWSLQLSCAFFPPCAIPFLRYFLFYSFLISYLPIHQKTPLVTFHVLFALKFGRIIKLFLSILFLPLGKTQQILPYERRISLWFATTCSMNSVKNDATYVLSTATLSFPFNNGDARTLGFLFCNMHSTYIVVWNFPDWLFIPFSYFTSISSLKFPFDLWREREKKTIDERKVLLPAEYARVYKDEGHPPKWRRRLTRVHCR